MSIKTVGELIEELQTFDKDQEVVAFSITRNFEVTYQTYSGAEIQRVEAIGDKKIVEILTEDFPIYLPFKDAGECFEEMHNHKPFAWVVSKENNQSYHLVDAKADGVRFYDTRRSKKSSRDNVSLC